jgi:hypothetical protein
MTFRLLRLAGQLTDRDRAILVGLDDLRLLRGDQLRKLFFDQAASEAGAARICRRTLSRLVELGLLARLEQRRVGGARSGSAGHVYTLTAKGRRLDAHFEGRDIATNRGVYEPSLAFVAHTLAISDLYVALVDAERSGRLELIAFESEPACWRVYSDALAAPITLKPDAHVRVAAGDYEYASFVEVDCGTVGRAALERKLATYFGYYRSGREQAANGVFPRIVWVAHMPARARYLTRLIAATPGAASISSVATPADAIRALAGQHEAPEPA